MTTAVIPLGLFIFCAVVTAVSDDPLFLTFAIINYLGFGLCVYCDGEENCGGWRP